MILLCRGDRIYMRLDVVADARSEYLVRHARRVAFLSDQTDPSATMQVFFERFQINRHFRCPNCGCLVYDSTNYMDAPEWFYQIPGNVPGTDTGP
jgi:hypothetical protein